MVIKKQIYFCCLLIVTQVHALELFGYTIDVRSMWASLVSYVSPRRRVSGTQHQNATKPYVADQQVIQHPKVLAEPRAQKRALAILSHIEPYMPQQTVGLCHAAGRVPSQEVDRLLTSIAQERVQPINDYFDFQEVKRKYPILKKVLEMSAVKNPDPARRARDKIDRCCLLQDHMERIVESFNRQYPHFKAELDVAQDLKQLFVSNDFLTFFKAFLLLHDIGKPLGLLQDQHVNTVPIMKAYLQKWHFTPKQIDLAVALVNDDIIGDMAIADLSIGHAHHLISKNADRLGLTKKTLYNLHHLFWSIDAGAYKTLQRHITQRADGKSVPRKKQQEIKQLELLSLQ